MKASEAETGDRGFLVIASDGAARGNPGPAGIGGIARDEKGRVVFRLREFLGEATNNVAEYLALIRLLECEPAQDFDRVVIRTDSEVLAKQLSGAYRVKSKRLLPLFDRVKRILARYDEVEVEHVRRERNREADRLANEAIDLGMEGKLEPLTQEGPGSLF